MINKQLNTEECSTRTRFRLKHCLQLPDHTVTFLLRLSFLSFLCLTAGERSKFLMRLLMVNPSAGMLDRLESCWHRPAQRLSSRSFSRSFSRALLHSCADACALCAVCALGVQFNLKAQRDFINECFVEVATN